MPTLEAVEEGGRVGPQGHQPVHPLLSRWFWPLFQSWGIAVGLQAPATSSGSGALLLLTRVITLTGGTMFLMWLGEQITSRGIGNGTSLIIFAGIVANLPSAIAGTLELGRQGAISTALILLVIVMAIAIIYFVVFMERAQRRLLINYPKRQSETACTRARPRSCRSS
jgi:preprotein translocase subunit SecY